jgi:CubicO group peptidase (beta-lactamase class C family)
MKHQLLVLTFALASFASGISAQAPGPRPPEPIVAATPAEFTHRADSMLSLLARNGWFSGAVLVAHGGETLFSKAYGLADREKKIPNTVATRFNVGSMDKMFTAVSIAQLAQAGKLSLGDKIGKHLANYPNAAVRDQVTIAQLLSHRGGLGSYWNDRFERDKGKIETVNDYLALFADEPLLFTPGERWEYSNEGFIVLGAIIEKVSGTSYFDYVSKNVFAPAGMTSTDFSAIRDSLPTRSVGYMGGDDDGPGPRSMPDVNTPAPTRTANWNTLPNRGGPAGGGYTTVEDLLRFGQALRAGKLVPNVWLDSLWTVRNASDPEVEGRKPPGYGYGFILRQGPLGKVVGHTGGAPGIAALLEIHLDKDYTVAVLSNVDGPGLLLVRSKLEAGVQGLEKGKPAGK